MLPARTRGPRRRGDNHNLVRTRPAIHVPTPPVPLLGYIDRSVKFESIADYASLATASWTAGTTGLYNGQANTSWNALYFHNVVSNRRDESVSHILNPIRISCDAPASNGGTYDWWIKAGTNYSWRTPPTSTLFGTMAISEKLLASSSHGEPNEGYLLPDIAHRYFLQGGSGTAFTFATLNAISGAASVVCSYRIAAFQHRKNGSAYGSLVTDPPPGPYAGTAWRIPIAAGDSYECDVWYEIKYTANPSLSPVAGKYCVVLYQTRVFNGSRIGPSLPWVWEPTLRFFNCNWNTAYDSQLHTYNLTKVGGLGWTLKDGSDGPHKMITGDGWTADFSNPAGINWTAPSSHQWISFVGIVWERELPVLTIVPKASLRTALGWTQPTPANIHYRPAATSAYRNSTSSTDHGTITHSPAGVFAQSGTTTWNLVQRSVQEHNKYLDGWSGLPTAIIDEVPTSFTTTRTTR